MPKKDEIQTELDAANERIAELEHENQALAARLQNKKPEPEAGAACCMRMVDEIVRRENISAKKHVAYRSMAAALALK